MYTGWIKCGENFQKMSGFKFGSKKQRHGGKFKYFNCEVTDLQLKGMKDNWEKFKEVEVEWDLKKKVTNAYGVKDGEVLLKLIGFDSYFFNKYENIEHVSKLREWKTHNGLYYSSEGRYVSEGFMADVTHIREDGSIYDVFRQYISEDGIDHAYDSKKIDSQIDILLDVKSKLIQLNDRLIK